MLAPTWQSDLNLPSALATAEKRPSPRRAMSSRKTRSTGSSAQKASTWSSVGARVSGTAGLFHPVRVASMPIHLRAEPGDYADAVLLPGDPLRAKYIAETYFDDVTQVNEERGLLGYTGTWEGKRISVQGTGMGCPGATIVFEELIQLGCKRLMRVGTCGGLQPHHALGDLIVALTAVPADATASHLVGRRAALPDGVLGADPRRRARGEGGRPADARRPDRLERRVLQPERGPVRAMVEPRRPRRRDGGVGALHRRRDRRHRQGARRARRLPPHRVGHRRRRASSRGSPTTSCGPRSTG